MALLPCREGQGKSGTAHFGKDETRNGRRNGNQRIPRIRNGNQRIPRILISFRRPFRVSSPIHEWAVPLQGSPIHEKMRLETVVEMEIKILDSHHRCVPRAYFKRKKSVQVQMCTHKECTSSSVKWPLKWKGKSSMQVSFPRAHLKRNLNFDHREL